MLALMPLSFIPKMNRAVTEKAVLIFLFAAGLGATVTATVRAVTLLGFYGEYSVAWLSIKTDLLTSIELCLGLIAANLPCLKGPTHRLLIRLGLISPSSASGLSFSSFIYKLSHGKHFVYPLSRLADSEQRVGESLYFSTGDNLQVPEAASIAAHRSDGLQDEDWNSASGRYLAR
jgi:hypothetical protein